MPLDMENIREFLPRREADLNLLEFLNFPTFIPKIKYFSKEILFPRRIYAFGDPGVEYNFQGFPIKGEPWIPALDNLKYLIESHTHEHYNFVILQYYDNADSYKSSLGGNPVESQSDRIPFLYLGSHQTLEFAGFMEISRFDVEHGSLLLVPNKYGCPNELIPERKEPAIVITFLNVMCELPTKKRKVDYAYSFSENDRIEQSLKRDSSLYDIRTTHFNLSDTITCVVKVFKGQLRVDMRKYNVINHRRIPTKEGIVMNVSTWYYFSQKIYSFTLLYHDTSFIVNNSLLCLNLDDKLHLQQLDCVSHNPPQLKQTFINLDFHEIEKLREMESKISECLMETLWTVVLPQKVLLNCLSYQAPVSDENEQLNCFLKCI